MPITGAAGFREQHDQLSFWSEVTSQKGIYVNGQSNVLKGGYLASTTGHYLFYTSLCDE